MAVNKIDSNATGAAYAEETSLGVLPGTPIWHPLEPNSYKDFGGKITTVARNPILNSRQRMKGSVTDLDASGGIEQDVTSDNLPRLLQGFFFANMREKKTTQPMNGTAVPVTGVVGTSKTYGAASGMAGFIAGQVVLCQGFGVAANNGLKTASAASTATALVTTEACADEASPPATAQIQSVGFQFPVSDAAIAMSGSLVRLTSVATDMTTLGLIPGEWIYIGADDSRKFSTNAGGFARISTIAQRYLEFDKVSWAAVAEAAPAVSVVIWFGSVLQNEQAANIVRKTIQIERQLGNDGNGVMSEYLIGAVANELNLNIKQADKMTAELSYVAINNEQRNGITGPKGGNRPAQQLGDCFNTSSDFSRISLSLATSTNAMQTPLFAYATELKITIKNGVTANKAVGVLGGFDTSAGAFEVSGSITAYFASIDAVQAVRNNSDVTWDMVIAKNNRGHLWDMPLVGLGDGRLNVTKDQPITIPLETNAYMNKFGTTLLFMNFPYLPTVAEL